MILYIDIRDETGRQTGGDVEIDSWDQVEKAIRSLDGELRTEVLLSAKGDDVFLGIYGGKDGRCYVGAQTDDEDSLAVVGNPGAVGEATMQAGGQEARFSTEFLVDVETALRVAHTYYHGNRLDDQFVWKKD